MTVVCLGEALVDLICPEPVSSPAEARSFEVHAGGAMANVAVAIARSGGEAALAGGVGDDPFGELLRERLHSEGVDLSRLRAVEGLGTPFALVTLDPDREPTFRIEGSGIEVGVGALRGSEREIVAGAEALVVASNTLVDEGSAAVTAAASELAAAAGIPLAFDVNLRAARWDRPDRARAACRRIAAGARLVKANRSEARWLLDAGADADDAALVAGLAALGPEGALGVLTLGPAGALAAGSAEASASAPVVSASAPAITDPNPLGSGDAFMGALCASLLAGGWSTGTLERGLERAVEAGAEAARRLGAID